MDLKVYKDLVTAAETVCETTAELPIETEILIPDYLPQVFKIVKCFVRLVILQKQMSASRMTADGYLRCIVYYQSESDQSLCQIEQKIPFTKQVELRDGDYHNWCAYVTGETEYLNCRAVNQRRIDIRGAYALSIKVSAGVEQEILTSISEMGTEQKLASISGARTVAIGEKLVTIEDSIAFDIQPLMILDITCQSVVNEVKLISGKAVIKGDIKAEISYRTEPGYTVQKAVKVISFNEVLDMDGVNEECQSFVFVEPTGCTVLGGADAQAGTISVTAIISARAYQQNEYLAVCDAFSTVYETETKEKVIALENIVDNFIVQVQCIAEGDLPDENAQIIDVKASALPVEIIEADGELNVRGRAIAHIICINALGEIDCYDKTAEYVLPKHYIGSLCNTNSTFIPSVQSVTARKAGAEMQANIVLSVQGLITTRVKATVIEHVEMLNERQAANSNIALRIYYAQAGEDIFDISKRYHVSPTVVSAINNTEQGVLQNKQQLLIPALN
ncbi:MAG: DUF3794 domain-containing protein [Oscillospiraceae bacterium]